MKKEIEDAENLANDDVPTPSRTSSQEDYTLVLRRSSRKRPLPAAVNHNSSPKNPRKSIVPPPKSPPTLLTLPYCAISRLLLHLDVYSLEDLSATCTYFNKLIAGRFLLTIDFPFSAHILKQILSLNRIKKKPLIQLTCRKPRIKIFQGNADTSMHNLIKSNCGLIPGLTDYLVFSQLSLLSLHKLREVNLLPESVMEHREGNVRYIGQKVLDSYMSIDCQLMKQISRFGSLSCLTRLDVMVDQNFFLEQFMDQLPNLLELGLLIMTRRNFSERMYLEYLTRLEAIVAATKAPILKVDVITETKRKDVTKSFKNSFVEKLVMSGPCTFNVFPVMERLKVVDLKLDTILHPNNCTYWKSKANDRVIHRDGACIVNIGAVYENCPNVERFMGVDVGMVSRKQSFAKWNTSIKQKFYKKYLNQGGIKEMKDWEKSRWFSRQPVRSAP